MSKERALDVFWLLSKLDSKDHHVWETLTEEQRKEFSAFITLRWMVGTTDPLQLLYLNEIVNRTVFDLPDHKELMMKLLAVCSNGRQKRYQWINYKLSNSKKNKLSVKLLADHLKVSEKDAEDSLRLFSLEELIEVAESQGWQKDEIKLLEKELK